MSMVWDKRFLDLCSLVAGWSKDPSTKCGSVIVRPDKTIVSVGYNGFNRHSQDLKEDYENREVKYSKVIHAEMNAVLNSYERVFGCTLYVTPMLPCDRCAVHVIQAGIKRVVSVLPEEEQRKRWFPQIALSLKYFKEAGVEVTQYVRERSKKETDQSSQAVTGALSGEPDSSGDT